MVTYRENLIEGYSASSCTLSLSPPLQVSYVSSSSTFTTHPCPMERHQLVSSDVMILCGLTNAPSANPDTMLHEMCNRMGESGY